MAVFFNGRLLITPAVASRVDDTQMANRNLTVPLNLAIIGRCDSGQPKTVYTFGNPVEVESTLQSGELYEAVRKAFAPSTQTFGPQTIYAIRVDPATQAHLVIAQNTDTSASGSLQAISDGGDDTQRVKLASGASGVDDYYNGWKIQMTSGVALGETNLITDYTGSTKMASLRYVWKNTPSSSDTYTVKPAAFCLDSTDYGLNANRVRTKIESGTVTGTKKISTGYASDITYKDNLAATYFTITYTGALKSCLMDVTASAITIRAGALGSETTIYTCDLSVYNTVSKVVDFFDAKSDITAAYTPQYRDYATYLTMDYVTGQMIRPLTVAGTSQTGGGVSSIKLAATSSDVNDEYKDFVVTVTSGACSGQYGTILSYNGSTKIATVTTSSFSEAPDAMTYEIAVTNVTGTAQAGGSATITLESWESATNDFYNGALVTITSGTGAGQTRRITDYVGSTKVATVGLTWTTTPDATSVYEINEASAATANLQAILDWVDGLSEPYATTYRPVQAGEIPENFDWEFLNGGTATSATSDDWQECFDLLQLEDVQCVVPLSSDASIHAMADAHCVFMSNEGEMERRCIVGGALEESLDEAVARAYILNSDRTYLVAPGYKDYDDTSTLVDYPPYMAAAILGGMITGLDPGESLTNKSLTIRGVEQKWRIPTDTDELITGGVIPIAPTRQGYKVIRSVSTWLNNDNYNRVEMGTGYATDYVARNVREALRDMIGKKGTPLSLVEAISRTENTLKELARPAPIGPEVIVGDDENPAYRNITAELEGDVLRVWFECSPCIPINFVLCSIKIVPYSGRASSMATQ